MIAALLVLSGAAAWTAGFFLGSLRTSFWKGRANHWFEQSVRFEGAWRRAQEAETRARDEGYKARREDEIRERNGRLAKLVADLVAPADPLRGEASHPLGHPIELHTIEELIGQEGE